ncbi:OCIA domain-containing protein 1 [Calliphora vicina]|uniref:OCIA domain-containing protein 1 n=1 Tax=Calliphora vicina TaxID=7373 RepID=UPI00325AEB91
MNPNDPQQQPQHPLANYQFSSEELRVFRECNSESFFQRSLPLGTTFGLAAYLGVKQGLIPANIKYGSVPKVILGVIMGYFVGKFSYQQKCAEKIMALPDSRLGEILRQRKNQGGLAGYKPDQSLTMGMGLGAFAPNPNDVYTDGDLRPTNKGNALNLDMESRPSFSGLDDIYRPNLDSPSTTLVDADIPLEPVKPGTSYEELRKRNREEYLKKQQNPFSKPLPPDAPVVMRQSERPSASSSGNDTAAKNLQTNKYGDAWVE